MIRSLPPKEKKKIRNLEKSLFQKIGENRGIFPKSLEKFWKNARISRKKCNLPKDPSTTRKRYIRELNNKVLDYSKLKPETIIKYNIQYDKNKDLYY